MTVIVLMQVRFDQFLGHFIYCFFSTFYLMYFVTYIHIMIDLFPLNLKKEKSSWQRCKKQVPANDMSLACGRLNIAAKTII